MHYERSARRDLRWWAMFLIGAVFVYAGAVVDPATNCDSSGRKCAPWLVPVAKLMGIILALSGAAYLVANPNRGSRFDATSGDLIWWQHRFGSSGGKEGRIHPSQISKIRIVAQSDSMDEVHVYNLEGERQAFFDGEVIPPPFEKWAKELAARWPHIEVESA